MSGFVSNFGARDSTSVLSAVYVNRMDAVIIWLCQCHRAVPAVKTAPACTLVREEI